MEGYCCYDMADVGNIQSKICAQNQNCVEATRSLNEVYIDAKLENLMCKRNFEVSTFHNF